MKRKDEIKDNLSNFLPHLLRIFEHQGEKCLGGLLQPPPPYGELGLTCQVVASPFARLVIA